MLEVYRTDSASYSFDGDKGWQMDSNFWVGIAVGAVLSIIASVIANLYTPWVSGRIARAAANRVLRTKRKAFAEYREISMIKTKNIDRYYFDEWMGIVVRIILASSSAVLAAVVYKWYAETDTKLTSVWIIFLMLACIWYYGAIKKYINFWRVMDILDRYDRYEEKLREKWGELPTYVQLKSPFE
jgi:multisubunit Na+/H+ antiporter MnhG subunit